MFDEILVRMEVAIAALTDLILSGHSLCGTASGGKDSGCTTIRGGSSHSGRRSFASNLVEQGHDIETVQQLLGHAELEHVRPYLAVYDKKLRQMFCDVL